LAAPKTPTEALVAECLDQSGNCLYASTNFFIWLKIIRGLRMFFIITPLVLGSLATGTLLTRTESPGMKLTVAVLAFLAGLLPTVYGALKLDDDVIQCTKSAAEFKNLQDRFRQCANISGLKSFAEFEAEFRSLMDRLEEARRPSYTPPEWCFRLAQKKVKRGDYDPDTRPEARS
jgi:hypothetical protein